MRRTLLACRQIEKVPFPKVSGAGMSLSALNARDVAGRRQWRHWGGALPVCLFVYRLLMKHNLLALFDL